MRVVWFKWLDSETQAAAWVHESDLDELVSIEALGYVVRETELSITLTTSYNLQGKDSNSPLTIPKCAIVGEIWDITF